MFRSHRNNRDKDKEGKERKEETERSKQKVVDEFLNVPSTGTGGTRTSDGHGTRRKGGRHHHNEPTDTYHTGLEDDDSNLELPPPEAEEALCRNCKDIHKIIYIDPKTKQPYPQKFAQRPEICGHCGQAWPKNKPYSDRIKKQVRERLADFLHDGKFSCNDCEHKLNGRRRALLIGINYSGQSHPLRGCKRDVEKMEGFLRDKHGFKQEDMRILMENWEKYRHPTREEIIKGMEWLVGDAQKGDSLFLHFSGHGGQTRDLGFDEPDGHDEGIYPVDYHLEGSKGILKDDDMHRILTDIPEGVQLTAIFDSCHSGSVLDLAYEMKEGDRKMFKTSMRHKWEKKSGRGRVILWSGCLDHQTSADTKIEGEFTGAMSYAFIKANDQLRRENRPYTYVDLYDRVHDILEKDNKLKEKKISQKPQLSGTDDQFLYTRVEY